MEKDPQLPHLFFKRDALPDDGSTEERSCSADLTSSLQEVSVFLEKDAAQEKAELDFKLQEMSWQEQAQEGDGSLDRAGEEPDAFGLSSPPPPPGSGAESPFSELSLAQQGHASKEGARPGTPSPLQHLATRRYRRKVARVVLAALGGWLLVAAELWLGGWLLLGSGSEPKPDQAATKPSVVSGPLSEAAREADREEGAKNDSTSRARISSGAAKDSKEQVDAPAAAPAKPDRSRVTGRAKTGGRARARGRRTKPTSRKRGTARPRRHRRGRKKGSSGSPRTVDEIDELLKGL